MSHMHAPRPPRAFRPGVLAGFWRPAAALTGLALVSACAQPLDFDLRGNFGNAFNTASAAQSTTAARPRPDDRGILSYPNYQVAVAQRGDSVQDVARRIGMDAQELASYNGLQPRDLLRKDEVLALPRRVAEPSPATGAVTSGPIQPASTVDIASIAGNAIDNATPAGVETTTLEPAKTARKAQTGVEPTRHKVARGETAYTISRLYGVSVKALADWNGLGPDFTIREGQFLLIPAANPEAASKARASAAAAAATVPGQGTPTPTPPSASKPLPAEKTAPAAQAQAKPKAPDLGKTQSKSSSKMGWPVNGSIIREFSKGKNEGIDISAPAGTAITAAANGTVAAITSSADKVPIVVVKHDNNLLTVYANVSGITVAKGDSVKRGQTIAKIRSGASNYVHFEVRKGFNSIDPMPYLN